MAYTDIDDPSAYFQTKLYTGGTAGAKTFDGNSNLKPDWFWCKKRGASQSHNLADSVRGITIALRSDLTAVEYTDSETDDLASFNTNGFTFSGTGDTYNGTYQSSSYVAWCWKAGTSFSNSAGANGASIASTGSFNNDAGFSIVSYTGTGSVGTIKHGLNSVPSWMIVKRRSGDTEHWDVYHASLGNTKAMQGLNNDGAADTSASYWNNTSPTSSVFTVGTNSGVNASSPYICYAFSEKQGYSKFSSYIGNGNSDGPFVYTGFKPAWFMTKRIDGGDSWTMFDNKRNSFNLVNKRLQANSAGAEDTAAPLGDFCANGVKIRGTGGGINVNGVTYIYMAFASNPFTTSTGVPATAK